MKLVIMGQTPSLKNNKVASINSRTGKLFIRTDEKTKEYMKDAKEQLKNQWKDKPLEEIEQLTCIFFHENERVRDLSNELDSVLDCLKGIVVVDDSYKCIPRIQMEWGGLDRQNPRVEIWVD